MARLPRLCVPGLPHCVLQQALPGQPWVRDDEDRGRFVRQLQLAAQGHGVSIHAYCLLNEQLQLLVTPRDARGLSLLMQDLGRGYVAAFNRRHQRHGPLWSGRFRATVVDPSYLLGAMVTIETEAQRRGVVGRAEDFAWSSLGHHLGHRVDALVEDAPAFWALGNTPFERQAHYLRLVQAGAEPALVQALERHTHAGWAWGSEAFVAQLQGSGVRRASPKPRGRPRKSGHRPAP